MSGHPIADGMRRRHSQPAVTGRGPRTRDLLPLIEAAASISDHAALRPWRIITVRGEARRRVGQALAEAAGLKGVAADKMAAKPLRAPLLLAIIAAPKPSLKVPEWEQDAVAAGIAHALCLVLDEAGWGVMWRTGLFTRSEPVRRVHRLEPAEHLLGWLYVGGKLDEGQGSRRRSVNARDFLGSL